VDFIIFIINRNALRMKKTLLLLCAFGYSYVSYSQYCTACGPSSTADSNVGSVQLTGSSGSINFIGCPGVVGLQDLTGSQSTTIGAGLNYTANIQFSTCGGNYAGAGQAWIDFNIDGVFDVSESIGTWVGTPPTSLSVFNFTVPISSLSGSTRMRVVQQEAGALPINPCASFTWGSTMDFAIIISGGIDCSSYLGDTQEDAIVINALPFSTTGDNSYCYFNQNLVYASPDIYYRVIPTPQQASISVSLCGSNFDTFLSVIDPNGNVIAYNDDGSCGTSSELTFLTAGVDTAFIIVEGWGSELGTFVLNIDAEYLGVDDFSYNKLTLYPNPTTGILLIDGTTHASVSIIDSRGSIIKTYSDYASSELDLSFLNPGIYFVKVDENMHTQTIKLTKQ